MPIFQKLFRKFIFSIQNIIYLWTESFQQVGQLTGGLSGVCVILFFFLQKPKFYKSCCGRYWWTCLFVFMAAICERVEIQIKFFQLICWKEGSFNIVLLKSFSPRKGITFWNLLWKNIGKLFLWGLNEIISTDISI